MVACKEPPNPNFALSPLPFAQLPVGFGQFGALEFGLWRQPPPSDARTGSVVDNVDDTACVGLHFATAAGFRCRFCRHNGNSCRRLTRCWRSGSKAPVRQAAVVTQLCTLQFACAQYHRARGLQSRQGFDFDNVNEDKGYCLLTAIHVDQPILFPHFHLR